MAQIEQARLERFVKGLECNQSQLRLIILLETWLRERRSLGSLAASC